MRKFLEVLLSVFYIVLVVTLSISSILLLTATNSSYYKGNLVKSYVYNTLPSVISTELTTVLEDKIEEQFADVFAPEVDASALLASFEPIIQENINEFLTDESIKQFVELNIDNVFNFINNKDKELQVFIPKKYLIEQSQIAIPTILDTIKMTVGSVPNCTDAELLAIQNATVQNKIVITCVPETLKLDLATNPDFYTATQVATIFQEVLAKNQFLGGEDTMSVKDLIQTMDSSAQQKEDFQETLEKLDNARGSLYTLRRVVVFLWVIVLIQVILFVVIAKTPIHGVRNFAINTVISSILILVPYMLWKEVFYSQLSTKLKDSFVDAEISEELKDLIYRMFENFTDGLFSKFFLIGLIVLITSIVIVVCTQMFINSKEDKEKFQFKQPAL